MLAVLLALLSVVAGFAPSGAADGRMAPRAADVVDVVEVGDACCTGGVAEGDASDPCAPGDPCPAPGGCCACLTCCKRIADVPATLRPAEPGGAPAPEAPRGASSGIDGVGAVWHPPRG